jgi:hypothetical protein
MVVKAVQELNSKFSSQSIAFETMRQQVASLSLTVEGLMAKVASSQQEGNFGTGTQQSLLNRLLSILEGFGVIIQQGLVKVQTLVASLIKTQSLEVGSSTAPVGITIYDQTTGQPVCVVSENGTLKSVPGKCGESVSVSQQNGNIGSGEPSPTPTMTDSSSPSPTASASASATPEVTPSPGPEITESPTPNETPSPTPEATPEISPESSPTPSP